jgi:RecJ-like exonuclease
MEKKHFNPEKYGMVACPRCFSHGYIVNPNRQCCPMCGGFGYIMKDIEEDPKRSVPETLRTYPTG